jgi:WhiB family redox-sensing transcriptional regulator
MDTDFTLHPDTDDSWADEAICKGLTHVFFGPMAERPERRAEREAIASSYCLACPAMLPCRRTARLNREHGFWGGENDEQRAAAGYAPRSPSRRAVIQARDAARRSGVRLPVDA